MKPSDFQKTVQCRFESCLKKVVRSVVKDYYKRGILNHAPLKTAYSSGSKSISSISKPKIILISASLIRPFNSISTTI